MSDSQPIKPKQKRVVLAVNERGIRIGEDHQNAKLSNEQIDRIRDLHEDHNLTYRQLAAMFSVSFSMIAGVCQYRRRAQTPFGYKTLRIDDEQD
jgi:hypothetical protein